jgi:hypothetical protein
LTITPVTQPVLADGVAVLMATEHRALWLVGVDPARGNELWRQPASTAFVPSGYGVQLRVVQRSGHDLVAYYAPDDKFDGAARLVVAEPTTGKAAWRSEPESFVGAIDTCWNTQDLCIDNGLVKQLRLTSWHFADVPTYQPKQASTLGDAGLYWTGGGRFGVYRNGHSLWEKPLDEFFANPETAYGWDLELIDGRYVGWVASDPYADHADSDDLSRRRDVGIDAATGRLIWKKQGSRMGCYGLVGAYRSRDDDRPDEPIRCTSMGKLVTRNDEIVGMKGGLDVEGFDPATGKATWSFPLGNDVVFARGKRRVACGDGGGMLLGHGASRRVVDPVTGARSVPRAGEVFLCTEPAKFREGDDADTRQGDTMLRVCDVNGKNSNGLPMSSLLQSLNQTFGDVIIMATPTGLVAYRTA